MKIRKKYIFLIAMFLCVIVISLVNICLSPSLANRANWATVIIVFCLLLLDVYHTNKTMKEYKEEIQEEIELLNSDIEEAVNKGQNHLANWRKKRLEGLQKLLEALEE